LLKSLGKTVKCRLKLFNIVWISTTFVKIDESLENYFTIFNESSWYSKKFFLGLKLLVFTKFHTVSPRLWPKSHASHEYRRYLMLMLTLGSAYKVFAWNWKPHADFTVISILKTSFPMKIEVCLRNILVANFTTDLSYRYLWFHHNLIY